MTITLDGTTGITTPGLTNTGTETLVNLTTTGNTTLGDATTDTLTVGVTGIVKDSSGNVGIGTATPSTYGKLVSLGADNATLFAAVGATNMLRVQGYNSTYVGTVLEAVNLAQSANTPLFINGSTIKFGISGTTQTTIDSSGNVGIGTSTINTRLQVLSSGTDNSAGDSITSAIATFTGPNYALGAASNPVNLQVMSNSTLGADVGASIGLGGRYSTTQFAQFAVIKGAKENATSGQYGTYLAFGTRANGTDISEKMRIDSSGNLLVGGTSQLGTSIASFYGGGTGVISMRNTASTAGRYWKSGPDSGGSYLVYNDANTGMYMLYGGTSWTASSDERTKTTLVPFENALEKVCTLRAGTGRYLKDEETVSRSFLIAQDVQKVLPEAVNVQNDKIGTLGLQYTDVIPLLVAAIKELNTTITQLTNRISALEAK